MCLIKMVYDATPGVTAACFLFRMVFSALTGATQSLLSTGNGRLCAPLSPSSQVPAWAAWLLVMLRRDGGVCLKQVSSDRLM